MRTYDLALHCLRGVLGCELFCALGGGGCCACCAWLAKLLVDGLTRICVTCVVALGPRGDLGGGKFCAAVRCTGGVLLAELVGVSSIKSFKATQLTAPKVHVLIAYGHMHGITITYLCGLSNGALFHLDSSPTVWPFDRKKLRAAVNIWHTAKSLPFLFFTCD